MREASEQAKKELADVRNLKPGSGRLDLFGFIDGDLAGGVVGGGASYKHRMKKNLSAFLRGTAGLGYGNDRGTRYEGLAGLEWTF